MKDTRQFDFGESLQNDVLARIVYRNDFLSEVRDRVVPDHFPAREQAELCKLAYDYYDKYGSAPGVALVHVIERAHRNGNPERLRLLLDLFAQLAVPVDGDVNAFLIDEIGKFVEHEELRAVLEDFVPGFERGEYGVAELHKGLSRLTPPKQGRAGDTDLLSDPLRHAARYASMAARPRRIATLIDPLDAEIGGLARGTLGTVVAPAGIGKSYFMVHLGKAALMQGCIVHHFTGEMSRDDIFTRYHQMMTGRTVAELAAPGAARAIVAATHALERRGGRVQVSKFGPGTTVAALSRELDAVSEAVSLIIVDYGELLETGGSRFTNEYGRLRDVWQELRDMAVSRNAAMWVASHASRHGVGAEKISELEVADSYWKVRISDIAIGFNRGIVYDRRRHVWGQETADHNAGTVRLNVIKNRTGESKGFITFACDLERGVFYSKKLTDAMRDGPDGFGEAD